MRTTLRRTLHILGFIFGSLLTAFGLYLLFFVGRPNNLPYSRPNFISMISPYFFVLGITCFMGTAKKLYVKIIIAVAALTVLVYYWKWF